ncbi:hypothetical protein FA13DRAFT_1807134 [Coprinellus micaceus]|uniref:Uncharacterized protein n=1 Tax=Coprinellus micaceus TaxID=71717 RepID=A0A4Y7RCC0_COPMI|nr:hypothetical protein FA13DRAFT_1807134 [Coprinellus micaceus]
MADNSGPTMAREERDFVYKGKATRRSWPQLPEELVRLIGSYYLLNIQATAYMPHTWESYEHWPQRLVYMAIRDGLVLERNLMSVCTGWHRALQTHGIWSTSIPHLDPANIFGSYMWGRATTTLLRQIEPPIPATAEGRQGSGTGTCDALEALAIHLVVVQVTAAQRCTRPGLVRFRYAATTKKRKASFCGSCLRDNPTLESAALQSLIGFGPGISPHAVMQQHQNVISAQIMEIACMENEDEEMWPGIEATCKSCRLEWLWRKACMQPSDREAIGGPAPQDPPHSVSRPWLPIPSLHTLLQNSTDWEIRHAVEGFVDMAEGTITEVLTMAREKHWLQKHTRLRELMSQALAARRPYEHHRESDTRLEVEDGVNQNDSERERAQLALDMELAVQLEREEREREEGEYDEVRAVQKRARTPSPPVERPLPPHMQQREQKQTYEPPATIQFGPEFTTYPTTDISDDHLEEEEEEEDEEEDASVMQTVEKSVLQLALGRLDPLEDFGRVLDQSSGCLVPERQGLQAGWAVWSSTRLRVARAAGRILGKKAEQTYHAHQKQMRIALLPAMRNVVRKLVIECGAAAFLRMRMTMAKLNDGAGQSRLLRRPRVSPQVGKGSVRMELEDVVKILREEEGVWWDGFRLGWRRGGTSRRLKKTRAAKRKRDTSRVPVHVDPSLTAHGDDAAKAIATPTTESPPKKRRKTQTEKWTPDRLTLPDPRPPRALPTVLSKRMGPQVGSSTSPVLSTSTLQTTPSPPPSSRVLFEDGGPEGKATTKASPEQHEHENGTEYDNEPPVRIPVSPVLDSPKILEAHPLRPSNARRVSSLYHDHSQVWREATAPLYQCRCRICERAAMAAAMAEQRRRGHASSDATEYSTAPQQEQRHHLTCPDERKRREEEYESASADEEEYMRIAAETDLCVEVASNDPRFEKVIYHPPDEDEDDEDEVVEIDIQDVDVFNDTKWYYNNTDPIREEAVFAMIRNTSWITRDVLVSVAGLDDTVPRAVSSLADDLLEYTVRPPSPPKRQKTTAS